MPQSYPCTWWEYTGRYTEFVDGIRSPIMRQLDTGEERSQRDLPVGALWVLDRKRDDGTEPGPNEWPPVGACDLLAIACKTIGSVWYIDSRASNCTKRDDKEHRCWVRHGTVGQPLTVDKKGLTCQAGAGSFYMDNQKWHGHLRNGVLVPA